MHLRLWKVRTLTEACHYNIIITSITLFSPVAPLGRDEIRHNIIVTIRWKSVNLSRTFDCCYTRRTSLLQNTRRLGLVCLFTVRFDSDDDRNGALDTTYDYTVFSTIDSRNNNKKNYNVTTSLSHGFCVRTADESLTPLTVRQQQQLEQQVRIRPGVGSGVQA